jgi:outer membrane protein insertion porin family
MKAFAIIAVLLLVSILSHSQVKPSPTKRLPSATSASAHRLAEIKVLGTNLYSPAQVIAATGLKVGENVNEEAFKDATQKLGETRLFTNVAYSYSFSTEGTKLELQLTDNEKLVPVEFDNLVWFSNQQLLDKIHEAIPLFQGKVPAGGGLVDQIADILSVLLAQKNPQLHLDYLRSGEESTNAVVFSVTGTEISIQKIEYPGASSANLAALTAASKSLEGQEYQHSALAAFIKSNLEPIYLKDGYVKAAFRQPEAHVVSESPEETVVDVSLPITEGDQYKLGQLLFSGNSVFPSEKLQALMHLQPGAPVNPLQLKNDLEAIHRLYGTRGHVKAAVESQPEFDDAASTVSYRLKVTEGDVYKMGDIELEGLEDKAAARIREDWTLREGEIYDSSYSQRFVKQALADLPSDAHWSIKVDESVNDKDKTVDVTLRFSKAQ